MEHPSTQTPGAGSRHTGAGIDSRGGAPPVVLPDALDDDSVLALDSVEGRDLPAHRHDGPPMEPPRPVLALLGLAGLGMVIAPFVFVFLLISQPESPPGAVNISPAAQQPIRNAQGELLPVQPGEPEEGEALVNVPPSPTGEAQPDAVEAAPPSTPPVPTQQTLPDRARGEVPTTTPPAQ